MPKAVLKIKEETKWGAIVCDGGRYCIRAVRHGVDFGFAVSSFKKDDVKQSEGTGKTTKHIRIGKPDDTDEKNMIGLINPAHKKAACEPCKIRYVENKC